MLKKKLVTPVKSCKRFRTYTKTTYVYECDNCHVEFERKQRDKRLMHFHSRLCYQASMKIGIAHDYVKSK